MISARSPMPSGLMSEDGTMMQSGGGMALYPTVTLLRAGVVTGTG